MGRTQHGYTLYELIVTVTIAAAVLVAGVPSMGALVARSRQVAEINALHHAIYRARSESIMQRRFVSLCPSSNGHQCDGSRDWSAGWLVFVNTDRDSPPQVDEGEAILDRHRVRRGIRLTANRQGFTLRGTRYRATNGTLVACDIADRAPPRALIVSYTGRPRAAQKNTAGESYACTG